MGGLVPLSIPTQVEVELGSGCGWAVTIDYKSSYPDQSNLLNYGLEE